MYQWIPLTTVKKLVMAFPATDHFSDYPLLNHDSVNR